MSRSATAKRCAAWPWPGVGLARLAAFQVKDDIAAGRLRPVLEAFNPGDVEEIHAVFPGQGSYLPLRALLDFLVEQVRFD